MWIYVIWKFFCIWWKVVILVVVCGWCMLVYLCFYGRFSVWKKILVSCCLCVIIVWWCWLKWVKSCVFLFSKCCCSISSCVILLISKGCCFLVNYIFFVWWLLFIVICCWFWIVFVWNICWWRLNLLLVMW